MSDDAPDMSEFEAQVHDIADPFPVKINPTAEHHGTQVMKAIGDVTEGIVQDIVAAMNEGRPALVQYLQQDGTSVTAILSDPTTMHIVVKHAAPKRWVVLNDPEA